MASKIHSHHVYVAITPYKVDGSSAEEFNELDVMTAYDDRRHHFYVCLHAGWKSSYGSHGCIIMGHDDPLTAPKYVIVKDAPRNSQKTIDEIGAAMELARDAIAWLFNKRDWQRLYATVRNIALHGYTEKYKQQMEQLMLAESKEPETEVSDGLKQWGELKKKHPDELLLFRCGDFYEVYQEDADAVANICGITLSKAKGLGNTDFYRMAGFPKHALDTYLPKLVRAGKRIAICDEIKSVNEPNKEDKDMRLNMNANKNESENVAVQPQVNNPATAPIEDADAVEIQEVEVAEVEDIVPTVKPKDDKPVTIPLSEHGTMVIGGVPKHDPKPAPEKPKRDKNGKFVSSKSAAKSQAEPDPEAVGELTGMMTIVTLVTYTTKNGDIAPRIVGFSGEDDPRWKPVNDEKRMLVEKYNKAKKTDKKAKLQSSPFGPAWLTDRETGVKTYCMTFGTKYMEVAKALCEAYNTTDKMAWHKAEDAVRALKSTIASAYKADREARKAERAAAAAQRQTRPEGKTYTNADVAAMLRQVMAGGDVPEDIKKLLKAA